MLNGNVNVQYPSSLFPLVGVVELVKLAAPSSVFVIDVTVAEAPVDAVITVAFKSVAYATEDALAVSIVVSNRKVYTAVAGKFIADRVIEIPIEPPFVVEYGPSLYVLTVEPPCRIVTDPVIDIDPDTAFIATIC